MKRVLVVGVAAIVLAGCGNPDIDKAHAELSKRLHDGDSVKFREDHVLLVAATKEKMVCGEFNAKNQLGAYNGFIPYVVEDLDGFPSAQFSDENGLEVKITCSMGKPE
jgi:hypothetical protein